MHCGFFYFSTMKTALIFPLAFTIAVVSAFLIENFSGLNFASCGIYPRRLEGLPGILFSPFIHGDVKHLLSNISALPILMLLLTTLYKRNYVIIFSTLYFLTGIFVWIFGRESYHIGASGIIYALASFVFFGGLVSKRKGAAAISMLVLLLYGGMVWGIFPADSHISWESHLFGGVSGFIGAFIFVKEKISKPKTDKDYDFQNLDFKYFSTTDNNFKITFEYSDEK